MREDKLDQLAAYALERKRLMERLQVIDDAAAEIVQGQIAQTKAMVEQWSHVVPKPPPVTRSRHHLPPGIPETDKQQEAVTPGSSFVRGLLNGGIQWRSAEGTFYNVDTAGRVTCPVKDNPQA